MEKRVLGKGFEVSAMGFGCMGLTHGRSHYAEKGEMIRLLHEAVDRGFTYFDTAEEYGPYTNELLLGEALEPYKNKIHISTKFGYRIVDGKVDFDAEDALDSRPATIRSAIEGCLKRLRLETLDLVYQHRVDPKVPIEDVAGTIADLIKEGKVLRWGLSEASVDTIRRAHAVLPLTAVESEYSMFWRDRETDVIPVLEELGIGLVPFAPLGRGYLTGTITKDIKLDEKDTRLRNPRFSPENIEKNMVLVDYIREVAAKKNATPAQIALAWLLAQKPWIVPIPGIDQQAFLYDNLGALDVELTEEDLQGIKAALDKIPLAGDRYDASFNRLAKG